MLQSDLLIVGAGIGGLSAAMALCRSPWLTIDRGPMKHGSPSPAIVVLERAAELAELGAGLQIGPNASRLLTAWGLGPRLDACAVRPEQLQVRDAQDGRILGVLRLGSEVRRRYGADYLTMHRADLHGALLQALEAEPVQLKTGTSVQSVLPGVDFMEVVTDSGQRLRSAALLACDGLWSQTRGQLLGDDAARASGHRAYRATLNCRDVPMASRVSQVCVWLGPHMHAVAYPVRSGAQLNLVMIVQASDNARTRPLEDGLWDQRVDGAWLRDLPPLHASLLEITSGVSSWRVWPLFDRPPLSGPQQMARGRFALLGDAAHPMRPYLAQGAAMAIEDAATLAAQLSESPTNPALAFGRYAELRWRRNARVQRRSRRNGLIFHADGLLRQARNLSMRLGGERVMDLPWLYGGGSG